MSRHFTASRLAEAEALLEHLVSEHEPGHALQREFSTDPGIYALDVERIWRRGWLFAGHACEVAVPGRYLTFDVDTDSVIVIRGDHGGLSAFHNTCRHRGMRLCRDDAGQVQALVCPYHQWTYARSGDLVACGGMDRDGDLVRTDYGLHPVHVREVGGLVFVCLADDPPSFEPAAAALGPMLRPQGLDRARIAAVRDYVVRANWKLVWENNRECYHCNANHPQYIKANFDHYNADDTTEGVRREIEAAVAASERKWAACGLAVTHRQTGMTLFPDPEGSVWYSANRTPLVPGYVSETMDGRLAAPIMGDYTDPDVGTLRVRAVPNFWNHSSCDHAVSTRLLPAGPRRTRARVTWLVSQDAVEGRDYELAQILPFWQLTSEQDWELCERAQRGIDSSAYTPGPYSTHKEYNVEAFVRWYLKRLSAA